VGEVEEGRMTPEQKERKRVYMREYYRKNAEERKAWQRDYNKMHVEARAVYAKAHRDSIADRARRDTPEARERHRLQMQKWRKANPDKVKVASIKWASAHKDEAKRYNKAYRKINAEKIKNRNRKKYLTNRESVIRRAKEYRELDPEKWDAYQVAYRAKNSERIKKRIRDWYATPRGKSIAKYHGMKRRALVPDVPARLIEVRFDLFNNECVYCGSRGSLHADHLVAVSRGGANDYKNIVPACRRCNLSKKTRPWYDWYLKQPFYKRWRAVRISKFS
jgi:5-methylcytosine-specific restriction endonuclease McrA